LCNEELDENDEMDPEADGIINYLTLIIDAYLVWRRNVFAITN